MSGEEDCVVVGRGGGGGGQRRSLSPTVPKALIFGIYFKSTVNLIRVPIVIYGTFPY